MNNTIKRLKVTCQSGTVTLLVCLAQPTATFASDTELYKAAQTSETTLMFMLDVSGSMSDNGSYDGTSETRLTRLKNGMYKLLQGDSNQGVERLPDNLSVGLSDFDGYTGRIKVEALPLSTPVTLPGTRQIYRQIEQLRQPMSCTTSASRNIITPQSRTQTRTKTETHTRTQTQTQIRTQYHDRTRSNTRTRTQTRANTNSSWSAWSAWSSWKYPSDSTSGWGQYSPYSEWTDWEATTDWSDWSGWSPWSVTSAFPNWPTSWNSAPIVNTGSSVEGAWTGGGACTPTANGAATTTSAVMQMCTVWQTNNTTCANWEVTNKTLAQITGTAATPTVVTGTISGITTQQGAVQSNAQATATWTPATPTATSSSSLVAPTNISSPAYSGTGGNGTSAVNTAVLVSSSPVAIGSASNINPTPTSVLSSNSKTETQTQTVTETQRQINTGTRTATITETESRITTESRTQTSNTITAREDRTDTTTATRADTRTTIYSGTATGTHRDKLVEAVNALRGGSYTPTAFAYGEVGAYMMGQTTKGLTGSGFSVSNGNAAIQDGNKYIAPARVTSEKQCNTQGIYFLTDGQPNQNSGYPTFMTSTLGNKGTSFDCSTNYLVSTGNSWGCIGNYAKALIDPTKNPAGVIIKTAVVGFGSEFGDGITGSSDVENAKKWGTVGQGGWYSGASALDVVNSVKAFLRKLDKYIPPVTTGSVTIPVDALDSQNVQPWAYYQQFEPKPGATGVVTWFGNVKKYKTLNNSLIDRDGASITNNNGLLKDDINDYWAATGITKVITKTINNVDVDSTVRIGGALSQMILGYNANTTPSERSIFTDRNIIIDPDNADQNVINIVTSGNLKKIGKADFLATSTNQFKEDPKRGYLLSLYGYNIPKVLVENLNAFPKEAEYQNSLEASLTATPSRDWLMGAVMHSKPILLTQKGTTKYENNVLTYDDRDDLILYGTTQGVLHVVRAGKNAADANAGKEVFAFVPNEMIENQAEGFLKQEVQSSTLKYGIDGQWTAYTEYVTKKGTESDAEPVITVKGGKQWVYGGLRMGGKSYYALDLTDISADDATSVPKIKFHIDPASATSGPLSYMGQSWSKPTLGWVNWKGKRKLVMFVGGGYDPSYEADDYNQTNGVGAGVYMFDAENGELLWWTSSNATDINTSATEQAKVVADMKYSVVSPIRTVDRNNDGLVDHLYFGDLGGQLWRTDLNNSLSPTSTSPFATHAIKLLDLHASSGASPRFYTTPTFTIHSGGSSGLFAAITIGSGNLSLPMSASGVDGKDAVYVIYDQDVTRPNLYLLPDADLVSKNIQKGTTGNTLASNTDGKTKTDLTRGGWYRALNSKFKVLNDAVAIDSDLYVSVFDANQDLEDSCDGGVRGKSDVYQFCLPYGQCTEKSAAGTTVIKNPPASIFLGKGNIGIAFGGTTGESSPNRSLVLNLPPPSGTVLPNYSGKLKLVSQRWYEKYAKAR